MLPQYLRIRASDVNIGWATINGRREGAEHERSNLKGGRFIGGFDRPDLCDKEWQPSELDEK